MDADINTIICIKNKNRGDFQVEIFGTQKKMFLRGLIFSNTTEGFCKFGKKMRNQESFFRKSYLIYNTTFPIPFSL